MPLSRKPHPIARNKRKPAESKLTTSVRILPHLLPAFEDAVRKSGLSKSAYLNRLLEKELFD